MKTKSIMFFNPCFLYLILLFLAPNICLGDFYTDDAAPDLNKEDSDFPYGNGNFSMKYNMNQGKIFFKVITHEVDGGKPGYSAWTKYFSLEYKVEGDNNKSWLTNVVRYQDATAYYEVAKCELPNANVYYGIEKPSFLNRGLGVTWQSVPFVNNTRSGLNDVYSAQMELDSIPTRWIGKTVTFYISLRWYRNAAVYDEDYDVTNDTNPIRITFPDFDFSNLDITAETNSCDNDIDVSFIAPANFTGAATSESSSTTISGLSFGYNLNYQEVGTSTWNSAKIGFCNPGGTVNAKHTGNSPGDSYKYKVEFTTILNINSEIISRTVPASSASYPTGSVMPDPPKPVIDSVVPGCGEAKVYFSIPGNDRSNIEKFVIRTYNSTGTSYNDTVATDHTISQYTVTGLDPGDQHYFVVISKNTCDNGTNSDASNTITILSAPQKTPTKPVVTQNEEVAHISWTIDNSGLAYSYSHFEVYRKVTGETSYSLIADNLPSTTLSFDDELAVMCDKNIYKVYFVNVCGTKMSDTTSVVMTSDFSDVIDESAVEVSTGYYNDRVEIKWDYISSYRSVVLGLEIQRRKSGEASFQQVAYIDNNQTTVWNDYEIDANMLYEYKIFAKGECFGEQTSNAVIVAGFRQKTGIVTGNVSFGGGNPVPGVEVKLSQSSNPGNSLLFEESQLSYLLFNNNSVFKSIGAITVEMWVYSDKWHNMPNFNNLFSCKPFQLYVNSNNLGVRLFPDNKTSIDDYVSFEDSINLITDASGWHYIAASYDGHNVKLYIDGELIGTHSVSFNLESFASSYAFLGARYSTALTNYINDDSNIPKPDGYFTGQMDEVRIWKVARTDEDIARDYNRLISGENNDLITYLRMDEGFGDYAYDRSVSSGEYNKMNAELFNLSWSSFTPSYEQLHASGITDAYGNYIISGITYTGTGEIFTVTPVLGVHRFSPTQKPLYIGDTQLVYNDVDFTDESSFDVSGKVTYSNAVYYPVSGVYIKLDGNFIMDDENKPVKTNTSGEYSIEVPIGDHYISVEKNGHVFESAYWPPKSEGVVVKHYFDDDLININFSDTTTVKLVGKVVGGSVEAAKPYNSVKNPVNNNLGVAQIKIKAINESFDLRSPDNFIQLSTDSETGIYEVDIIPESMQIYEVKIAGVDHFIDATSGAVLVDLTNKFEKKYTIDSIFSPTTGALLSIDTTFVYNHGQDFILRNTPTFDITNMDDEPVFGDTEINVDVNGSIVVVPLVTVSDDSVSYNFGYPVFTMGQTYSQKLFAFEEYVNVDNDEVDKVPVTDGSFVINNELSETEGEVTVEIGSDGEATYSFNTGFPAVASPYIKSMQVQLKIGDNYFNKLGWPLDAYILGFKPSGNNFVTYGPDNLNFILRDPPGSGSSASLESNTTVKNTNTATYRVENSGDDALVISTGQNITVASGIPGFMQIVEVETKNDYTIKVKHSEFYENSSVSETSTTFTNSISTNSTPLFVGAPGDLFYGNSTNILFGETFTIAVEETDARISSDIVIETFEYNSTFYDLKLARKLGLGSQFATSFIYSQKFIEETLLPNLLKIRNELLENSDKYESVLPLEHENYGKNNDDPVFLGVELEEVIVGDTIVYKGPSYKYYPDFITYENLQGDSVTFADLHNDSVRFYNNQIELWKFYLEQNELQKTVAVLDDQHKNISFDAGASYSGSVNTTTTETVTHSGGFMIGLGFATDIGFSVNELGLKVKIDETVSTNETWIGSTNEESSIKVGYNLVDEDKDNYFSVDVKKCIFGNGPVFSTRGGQTSCPYEGEILTEYYVPGIVLSNATVQIENPKLSVNPTNISGVPEEGAAYFELSLSNETESGLSRWFTISVDASTNPDNAKIYMDGTSLTTGVDIFLPAGNAIKKTIEVRKGVPDVFVYDGIAIDLYSQCEGAIIYDEVVISASFEPSCTEVEFGNLANDWVMNLYNKDTLNLNILGYDRNNSGFEKISLQYKKPGDLLPVTVMNFYNLLDDFNSASDPKELLNSSNFIWPLVLTTGTYPDGIYDIRAVALCANAFAGESNFSTPYFRGTVDRIAPHAFGAPRPADGVLSINDEILLKYNEPIDAGFLYARKDLIKLQGVLNSTDMSSFDYLLHDAYLNFDGIHQNVLVSQGINLKYTPFTFEFWANRSGTGQECLIEHGTPESNGLWIGFNQDDKFQMIINGDTVTTTRSFDDVIGKWCHFGCSFITNENHDNEATISVRYDAGEEVMTKSINSDYYVSGPLIIGNTFTLSDGFYGSMHNLRIWNNALTTTELAASQYALSSGYEKGLIGCWPMDDLEGTIATDLALARHGTVNATWQVSRKGKAINLADNNYFSFDSGEMIFSDQSDFSIEFWLKGNSPLDNAYLFGNGKADGTDQFTSSWAIVAIPGGKIKIMNNGTEIVVSVSGLFDNNWHHVAVSVNRHGNLNVFMDGILKHSSSASSFSAFGAPKCYVGASHSLISGIETIGNFFSGGFDELRIWNTALNQGQVQDYMHRTLTGDEPGLKAYFPFEDISILDPLISNVTFDNMSNTTFLAAGNGTLDDPDGISIICPMLRLNQPKQDIPFTYSINNDEVIITPSIEQYQIENTTLEISVQRAKDLFGNEMASTIRWSAFVDKNQLLWEKQSVNLTKLLDTPLKFEVMILNKGGITENFSIDNLPAWLTASPSTGYLDPLESTTITFTVNQGINVGIFSHDVYLNGSMNYNERLEINLIVKAQEPNWVVQTEKFQHNITLVGQLKIGDLFSTDVNDMVGAFYGEECRGVAHLTYYEESGIYLVIMQIYGNEDDEGIPVSLRVWDASEGMIYIDVTPKLEYHNNTIIGTPAIPELIYTEGEVSREIQLANGWKWVSFNLYGNATNDINVLMQGVPAQEGDQIKGRISYDSYSNDVWEGLISSVDSGVKPEQMYMIKLSEVGVIRYSGLPVEVANTPIPINLGWNWIGYTPQSNIPVKEAFSYFTPTHDDLIKSQYSFSMYDKTLGWIGSLEIMQPGLGYIYYSKNSNPFTFIYPLESSLKRAVIQDEDLYSVYGLKPEKWKSNMSVVAEIKGLDSQTSSGFTLFSFNGNELRGVARPILVNDKPVYFLTVYGEDFDQIYFTAEREEEKVTFNNSLTFFHDDITGTILNPYILSLDNSTYINEYGLSGSSGINCYPNPFKNNVVIQCHAGEKIVKVEIYNILGEKIRQLTPCESKVIWDGNNSENEQVVSGIYTIHVFTGNRQYSQLIVKN